MKRETSNTKLKGEIYMYLRKLLDKTKWTEEDSIPKAMVKGFVEGTIEGLIVVGAIEIVSIAVDTIKKK